MTDAQPKMPRSNRDRVQMEKIAAFHDEMAAESTGQKRARHRRLAAQARREA